jgi:hypothetical protein
VGGAYRAFGVLFLASALIGASWSPLRAISKTSPVKSNHETSRDRNGAPVVYMTLPVLRHDIAVRPDGADDVLPLVETIVPVPPKSPTPFIKAIRFGKHKGYERLVFDFSDRLDFWYWTLKQGDTLTLEFPALQPFTKKPLKKTNCGPILAGHRPEFTRTLLIKSTHRLASCAEISI